MNKFRDKKAEIVLDIVAISEGALLLSDGDRQEWIPKSLVDNFDKNWEADTTKKLVIPVWKLRQAEFI
jgi:hypothetical protein